MGTRVLITGGAGFIGLHLADELLAHGHHVRVVLPLAELDRALTPPSTRPDGFLKAVVVP